MTKNIKVTDSPHVTVILVHGDAKEVHRFDTNISFKSALERFSKERGIDGEIKSTKFGTMLLGSDGVVYRATYRRKE